MTNAAPDGNPMMAAIAVAEKLTITENATMWARVAVPKDLQTSNIGISTRQLAARQILSVVLKHLALVAGKSGSVLSSDDHSAEGRRKQAL